MRRTNIIAALALAQLEALPGRLDRLRANTRLWQRVFRDRPGFVLPELPPAALVGYPTFTFRFDAAPLGVPVQRALAALHAEGVPLAAAPIERTVCMLLDGAGRGQDRCCPGADEWRRHALQFPCPDAPPEVFEPFASAVASALDKVFAHRARLRKPFTTAAFCNNI